MDVSTFTTFYNGLTEAQGKSAAGADSFRMTRELLRKAGYRPGMSLLDYGCGWGSLLEVIDDYGDYEGVDISPFMIHEANRLYPDNSFRISLIGEVDNKADFTVVHSVFTHIPKAVAPLALRDIGNLGIIDIFWDDHHAPGYEHYTHMEWLDLLKQNGFRGKLIGERARDEYFKHYYYKVSK